MQSTWRDSATAIGLLVLRLGIGGYMLTHGWGKLQLLLQGQFDAVGDPIGLGGKVSLILVTFAEFSCSLLVMIGLFTRLAALPIVFAMAVAAFVVHADDPWTMGAAAEAFFAGEVQYPASKQPALVYLIVFLSLALTGAGRLSLDAIIWRRSGSPDGEA